MDASTALALVAFCFAVGCGSSIRPGLANAPALGGMSPETHVHDAIANDHDACEKPVVVSEGEGQGQPSYCRESSFRNMPDFRLGLGTMSRPAPSARPVGVCSTGLRPRIFGAERSLTAYALSGGRLWLSCDWRGGRYSAATPDVWQLE
jgi:hypothetical protein